MTEKKKKDMTELRTEKMIHAVETVSRDFEEKKVQERKGQGGKMFKYVKAQEYIVRLNDVFGLAWSCEIVNHWFANNQVVIWVRISYPNVDYPDDSKLKDFKDGIDAHPLSQDVGNSYKAAYSKAFKKAAVQVGISLNLWGVSADDDEADEGYQYQAGGPLPPNVIPVNPGPHNPPIVPGPSAGYPPAPPAPVTQVPPVPVPQAPPVPQVPGNTMPPVPPQPQFVNPQAANTSVPPPPPPVPLPPLPTGNPNPAIDTSNAVGITSGPGTGASASLSFTGAGTGADDNAPLAEYMVNGIKGAAITRGLQDPMDLVRQVLGAEAATIPAVESLKFEQAQRVLEAVRQIPPQ